MVIIVCRHAPLGEIRRINCLPPISQNADAISTQRYTLPASETSISSFPSARAARLWATMNTYSVGQGK